MQSAHLVAQRKAFQQSMEDVLTLSREQTSSQPLIASALEELKVLSQAHTDDFEPVEMRVYFCNLTLVQAHDSVPLLNWFSIAAVFSCPGFLFISISAIFWYHKA